MENKLLVSGASGQLGQRVLHHLLHTLNIAPQRIIATTRTPATLADLTAKGIEVRAADFSDPASLQKAFSGSSRLLLISTGDPGDRATAHKNAIHAAENAGVQHLVYTSIPNPVDASLHIVRDHAITEKTLAASQLPGWTVLRNNWYFENLLHTVPGMLQTGQWATASGNGGIAWIARDDLALAAATALAGNSQGKNTLTLNGGKNYTAAELADLLQKTQGKPVAVVPVSVADLAAGMEAHGLPAIVASMLSSADAHIAAGRLQGDSSDFTALTGRKPQALSDWLATQSFV